MLIPTFEQLEDRVRTMKLVRRNRKAVTALYVRGILLCNDTANTQAEAFASRIIFRQMVAAQLPKESWPDSLRLFFQAH